MLHLNKAESNGSIQLKMQIMLFLTFGILVPAPMEQAHFLQNAAKHL